MKLPTQENQSDKIDKIINTTDNCKAESSEDGFNEVPNTGKSVVIISANSKSVVTISANSKKEDSVKDESEEATNTAMGIPGDSSKDESDEATNTGKTVIIPIQTDKIVKIINTTDICKADSSEDEFNEVVSISINSEKEETNYNVQSNVHLKKR